MLEQKATPLLRVSRYHVTPFFPLTMSVYWAIKMSKEELNYSENKFAYSTQVLTFRSMLVFIRLGQVMGAEVYTALKKRLSINFTMSKKYLPYQNQSATQTKS